LADNALDIWQTGIFPPLYGRNLQGEAVECTAYILVLLIQVKNMLSCYLVSDWKHKVGAIGIFVQNRQ